MPETDTKHGMFSGEIPVTYRNSQVIQNGLLPKQ